MKQLARMQNLAKRNSLSRQEIEQKSKLAAQHLFKLPEFEKAKAVMLYASIDNEVQTPAIIEKALQLGKRVVLPVTDFEAKSIAPVEIHSLKELHRTKQGLLEPAGKKPVKATGLDLIVLPGIAFDRRGNRIGTGKGFYDSLLRKVSTTVPLVGLCFEENLEELLPSESHDVKMDIVVTGKEIVRCKA